MSDRIKQTIDKAKIVRAAIIECSEERDGHLCATEDGCRRLRAILDRNDIQAVVSIGDDGKFLVRLDASAVLKGAG